MKYMEGLDSKKEDDLTSKLPPSLRGDVLYSMHHSAVQNIALFKDAPTGFLRAIINSLEHFYLMPREVVIRLVLFPSYDRLSIRLPSSCKS